MTEQASVRSTAVAPTRPEPLHRLAQVHGVETSYLDVHGERQDADADALLAVLRALGCPVQRPDDADGALASELRRRATQVVEPVVAVVRADQAVPVVLPPDADPSRTTVWLSGDDGRAGRLRLLDVLGEPVGIDQVDGRAFRRYAMPVSGLSLGPGYHRLVLEGGGLDTTCLVMVAVPCPTPARGWGAFLPLHALRTETDRGVGTYADLADASAWIAGLGGSFFGTLPLFPAVADEGRVEPSPYVPSSRLAWSELYIEPTRTPEWQVSPEAGRLEASEALARDVEAARRAPLVDYTATAARLRTLLEPLAEAMFSDRSGRRGRLEEFARRRPEMVEYARHRSSVEQGRPPVRPVRPAPATGPPGPGPTVVAPDLGSLDPAARVHLYAQFVADEQLEAAGDRLYLDQPVGVHPSGFDAWWESDAFAPGVGVGAPPDSFFEGGQNWGFQPLHPGALRTQHYRYPVAGLRHIMDHAAVVRIDHVMALQRLYWIPEGFDARHGVYVRYPIDEMRAVIALEAHRSGTAVVGEDLGTVPPEVTRAMDDSRMLHSWVLEFAGSGQDPLPEPPPMAMASIGTHDLPRFASFWDADDLGELVDRGAQTEAWATGARADRMAWRRALEASLPEDRTATGAALAACLDHLASSRAQLMMVDLEDLWSERRPVNRPGTGPEIPNWRTRADRTLEEMRQGHEVGRALERIDRLRRGPALPVAATAADGSQP